MIDLDPDSRIELPPESVLGENRLDADHALALSILAGIRKNRCGWDRLEAHLAGHFEYEELLARRSRHPDWTIHRLHHRDLMRQIEGFDRSASGPDRTKSTHSVEAWLASHLRGPDRELVAHLKDPSRARLRQTFLDRALSDRIRAIR